MTFPFNMAFKWKLKLTKGRGCILKEGDEVVLSFSELGACMRIRFTVKASLLLNIHTSACMHVHLNSAKDLLSAVKNQNIFCLSININCHMIQCKAMKREAYYSASILFVLKYLTGYRNFLPIINWLTSFRHILILKVSSLVDSMSTI